MPDPAFVKRRTPGSPTGWRCVAARVRAAAPVVMALVLAACAADAPRSAPGAVVVAGDADWLEARVMAATRVVVATEVDGRVARVLARQGDHVAADDPLLVLDPAPFDARVVEAVDARARATDRWRAAAGALDRQDTRAFNPTYTVDRAFDATRARIFEAERDAAVAARVADRVTAERAASVVRAPIAGRVADLVVVGGQTVVARQTVARIDDDDAIEAHVAWPTARGAPPRAGARARVAAADTPAGRDVAARVLRIEASESPAAATTVVVIGWTEPAWWPAGTPVRVRFTPAP
ncbi:MAG: biotin/lipoyl-binding protein [Burkholderiales bacterium]|nr:biotin/lipoyl-binding protein [Burkholderiales bacterium]